MKITANRQASRLQIHRLPCRTFADRFRLAPDQREALIKLDLPAMVKMGAHPLVPFLAQLQMQRETRRP